MRSQRVRHNWVSFPFSPELKVGIWLVETLYHSGFNKQEQVDHSISGMHKGIIFFLQCPKISVSTRCPIETGQGNLIEYIYSHAYINISMYICKQ